MARDRPRSIWVNSWGSDSPAKADDAATTAASPPRMIRPWLSINQSPRVLQIFVSDRRSRPVGQGADSQRRVVSGVLRESARSQHEQVRHVPALLVTVERAGFRIGPHHGAATHMRRLILGDVVWCGPVLFGEVI